VSPFSKPTVHRQVGEKHDHAGKEGQVRGGSELGCAAWCVLVAAVTSDQLVTGSETCGPCTALNAADVYTQGWLKSQQNMNLPQRSTTCIRQQPSMLCWPYCDHRPSSSFSLSHCMCRLARLSLR
jgi:hypothetical protein